MKFFSGCQNTGWADSGGKLFTIGCCLVLVLKAFTQVLDFRTEPVRELELTQPIFFIRWK